jgi:hypothetical protein
MRHFSPGRTSKTCRNTVVVALAAAAIALLTGCHHHCQVTPSALNVDPAGNAVLEPGETVDVAPSWHYASLPGGPCLFGNPCPTSAGPSLYASNFTGPAGAVYTIVDDTAAYSIPITTTRNCFSTGDCYVFSLSAPDTRPAAHWDATFVESGSPGAPDLTWIFPMGASALEPMSCGIGVSVPKTWTLHVGASFSDVSTSSGFYPFIENLFHHGVTAGCGDGGYCPGSSIRRDQMSVFLLKSKYGSGYAPPPCAGLFVDVPCPGMFTDWVEQIYNEGVIGDCGAGLFCPGDAVTRRDMAVWLLKASQVSGYVPPPATGLFGDVPIDDPQAAWIEDLYNRQITAGCNANPLLYCPGNVNTRQQMAVFMDKTFGLQLYGL